LIYYIKRERDNIIKEQKEHLNLDKEIFVIEKEIKNNELDIVCKEILNREPELMEFNLVINLSPNMTSVRIKNFKKLIHNKPIQQKNLIISKNISELKQQMKENLEKDVKYYSVLKYSIYTELESSIYTSLFFNPKTILSLIDFNCSENGIVYWELIKTLNIQTSDFENKESAMLIYLQIFLYFFNKEKNGKNLTIKDIKEIQRVMREVDDYFSEIVPFGKKTLKLLREDITVNKIAHIYIH